MKRKDLLLLAAGILALTGCGRAHADTLAEAIATVYLNNPTIQAQRAELMVLVDRYDQAQAAYAPTLSVNADAETTSVHQDYVGGAFLRNRKTQGVTLSFVQALYTGGRIKFGVTAARAGVLAGGEQLRSTEMKIIQQVIEAYIATERDQEIANISDLNVSLLQKQLEDTQARARIREVTVTDLATAQSRLASAQAQAATSKGQLQVSRAQYVSVVGVEPGVLEAAPELPGMPDDRASALETARTDNPEYLAAKYTELVSRAQIQVARSGGAPQLSLQADAGRNPLLAYDPDHYQRDVSVSVVVSVPLFTGGRNRTRVREAIDADKRDSLKIDATQNQVVQAVSEAWARLTAASAATDSYESQVKAAEIAFDGVRQEEKVGLRTTLDVLNLEQELSSARVSAAEAQHDEYSARTSLLLAMGQLDAYHLTGVQPDIGKEKRGRRFYEVSPTELAPRLLELLTVGGSQEQK